MPLSKIQFGNTGSSHKNIIINGGMQVAQRSTSAVTSVNQEYKTVDRVKAAFITTGTVQTQQVSDVPAGEGFSHSMKTTVTGADTSVAAGDFIDLYQQRIEARNISTLMYGTSGAKTTTLSFYVKSNVTGVYNGTITNQNDSVKLPFSFSISSANTWERIIIDNIPPITTGSDSGTAWETSTLTNMGAAVRIYGMLGSTYYGATNKVWNTAGAANSYGHQAQVNFLSSTSNNFFITGMQWEEGSAATEFEHRLFAEELRLCMRYYEKSYNYGVVPGSAGTSADVNYQGAIFFTTAHNNHYEQIQYKERKRAAPTLTLYNTHTGATGQNYSHHDNNSTAQSDTWANGENGVRVAFAGTGDGERTEFHYTAESEL